MTDFKQQVAKVSATLRVVGVTRVGEWTHWTIGHNPESQDAYTCSATWVVQGPCSLIVTGDMGTMVFERPSGRLGLGFARSGLSYIAEKCAAGKVWEYDGGKARAELVTELQDFINEDEADGNPDSAEHWRAKLLDADDIDFEDERAITEWYYENVRNDEVPDFGQKPSPGLLRALACIEAALVYETTTG